MNRIDHTFKKLRQDNKKAFIAFITSGDPDLKTTHDLVLAFEKAGADIIELGVPFSDPMADGPTIQAASMRALEKGTSLVKVLDLVRTLRTKTEIPLCLMTYYNIIFHYGEERFVRDAKAAGVDGIIIPDLPHHEAEGLIVPARKADLATVFFIAPTTSDERVRQIAAASTGFIYYVSLTGVTGTNKGIPKTAVTHLKRIRTLTSKPVCVGFGVSTPLQVKEMASVADGVIVGSAIVKEIQRYAKDKERVAKTARFVKSLASAR